MSLLLDALKKAAKDKQTADATAPTGAGESADAGENTPPRPPEMQAQPDELELPETAPSSGPPSDGVRDEASRSRSVSRDPFTPITATPSTVTDDALQLLIHRTNREYRRSQFGLWSGVILGVLLVLALGGVYFYFDMNNEIETIERKHRNELAALQSRTRIEDNLTALAGEKKAETQRVEPAKKPETPKPAVEVNTAPPKHTRAALESEITIRRSSTEDPVSTSLNRAWRAYQHKDYKTAGEMYAEVLEREPNNRDALLGIAAVAMQTQNPELARTQYIRLLELDPRDPRAHAGMASIAQMGGASLSETRLKQLIEHSPNDATLRYTLGNLYVKNKDWPGAQAAYFKAWELDNQNPDYAFNLAVSLDHLGKPREAATYYRDSLRLAEGKNIHFSKAAVEQRLQSLQGSRP